jgi:pyridoxal 5'-phosphate synthase pdxT subunit
VKLLPKNIGILSFLGPFVQHQNIFQSLGVHVTLLKEPQDLDSVDALVIPGSETKALETALQDIFPAIAKRIHEKMPIFLTGEACVLLSEEAKTPLSFKKMNIKSFQNTSLRRFNEEIYLSFSDTKKYNAPYVRSPEIDKIAKNFTVLASKENTPHEAVCIEKDNILAMTFYPELSEDKRMHEYFITKIP